jgi:trans-aconitate methyltransferase
LHINDIDFEDEFDIIISNATLHWVQDHKRLIENCHRALKENGVIRFNFAGDGNCSHLIEVIRDIMNNRTYKRYFADSKWPWYLPTINDYRQLLTINNFREIRIWDENADRYFKDADEMIGWIDQPAIVPFIAKIDDSKKGGFRKAIIDQMVGITRQEDGRCFETFRRINVYGKK